MTRSFRSEWIKLRRPSVLFGTAGAMAAFVTLLNFGIFRSVGMMGRAARPGAAQRAEFILRQLESPAGAVRGVVGATSLLGIIALCVVASNVGSEYKNQTIRFLLVSEPRRLRLLGGKLLALASLVAIAIAVATVTSVATGLAFGALFDIGTSTWFGGEGLQLIARTYFNIALGCMGWGLLGALLALLFRSSNAAIGVGIGYLLLGEALILRGLVSSLFDISGVWFPAEVLQAFAAGGTAESTYIRAAALALAYAVVMAAGGLTTFTRRDVLT